MTRQRIQTITVHLHMRDGARPIVQSGKLAGEAESYYSVQLSADDGIYVTLFLGNAREADVWARALVDAVQHAVGERS